MLILHPVLASAPCTAYTLAAHFSTYCDWGEEARQGPRNRHVAKLAPSCRSEEKEKPKNDKRASVSMSASELRCQSAGAELLVGMPL